MNKHARIHRLARFTLSLVIASSCIAAPPAFGQQTIIKDDDTDNLNSSSSWVVGVVPGSTDTAVWDSTVTSANNVALGGNFVLRWIKNSQPRWCSHDWSRQHANVGLRRHRHVCSDAELDDQLRLNDQWGPNLECRLWSDANSQYWHLHEVTGVDSQYSRSRNCFGFYDWAHQH